jgi:hypothetical protein
MKQEHDALVMDFPDEKSAHLAADTFGELGYDPVRLEGRRVHIHVRNEDLVSALEIMQSCGGNIAEQAQAETSALTNLAYGMEEIPIPAHTVNEDWTDAYADGQPEKLAAQESPDEEESFRPDDGSYSYFDAR